MPSIVVDAGTAGLVDSIRACDSIFSSRDAGTSYSITSCVNEIGLIHSGESGFASLSRRHVAGVHW
jgi:hypothetical protein